MFFWDYGNAFLLEARRAGADVSPKNCGGDSQNDILNEEATAFRYPSYVQDIMGWVTRYFSICFIKMRLKVIFCDLPSVRSQSIFFDLSQVDQVVTFRLDLSRSSTWNRLAFMKCKKSVRVICNFHALHCGLPHNFFSSNQHRVKFFSKTLIWRKFYDKSVAVEFPVWKREILSHQKFFCQINSLVTYLVKVLLSRNFCQKYVIENFR